MPASEFKFLSPPFVGYFDYAVIALLVAANVWCARRGVSGSFGCWSTLAAAFVFCLLLPMLSIWVELNRIRRPPGMPVDGYEMLYVYLRFPMYWALFVLQLLFLKLYSWCC